MGHDTVIRDNLVAGSGKGQSVRMKALAALEQARRASPLSRTVGAQRLSEFLRRLDRELDVETSALIAEAQRETAIDPSRLSDELDRTRETLRIFASEVTSGLLAEAVIDTARGKRPDIRRLMVPLGPVVVFEAGNMPFFLGAIGADVVAAWSAGCPVLVKVHPGHPQTAERLGHIVSTAMTDVGLPKGTFALVGDQDPRVSQALVRAPEVQAVAFTGSIEAARVIREWTFGRADMIPFFAEMGSLNPVFITLARAASDSALARTLAESIQANRGQLCTNPTVIFLPPGQAGDRVSASLAAELSREAGGLLNDNVATRLRDRLAKLVADGNLEYLAGRLAPGRDWAPVLLDATWKQFQELSDPWEELFGPVTLLVRADDDQMVHAARSMPGQLTATIWTSESDNVGDLANALQDRVGRLIWNGVPTGVPITAATQHGGPFPASSHASFSSMGLASVRRFQRPVSFQNAPDDALPLELRDSNPLGIVRLVDGLHRAEAVTHGQP